MRLKIQRQPMKKKCELDFRMYDEFIANEEVLTGKADDNLVPSLE